MLTTALISLTFAAEPTPSPAFSPDLSEAVELPGLTSEQYDELKPKHQHLPQLPYAQTDFTAYTLEWGEVKLGIANLQVGIAPRVQLGTSIPLDTLGLWNVTGKWNMLRVGPLDLGVQGYYYRLNQPDFDASFTALGAMASVRLMDPWSLHGGVYYDTIKAHGLPDPSRITQLLQADGGKVDAIYAMVLDQGIGLDADAHALGVRMATDVRFNRRDSIILQGQTMVYRSVNTELHGGQIFNVFGLDDTIETTKEGALPIASNYITSLSYQASWRTVDLRVGLGWSVPQFAWALQAIELDYRFGGKTRINEHHMRKTWRHNDQDIAG